MNFDGFSRFLYLLTRFHGLTLTANCGFSTIKSSSWLHNCSVSWTLATPVILIKLCADSLSMYSDGFTNVWMSSPIQKKKSLEIRLRI